MSEYLDALIVQDLAGGVDHTVSKQISELHPLAQQEQDRRLLKKLKRPA